MSDQEWANESLRKALQNIEDAATKPLHVEIERLRRDFDIEIEVNGVLRRELAEARELLRRALNSDGGSAYEEGAEFGIRCCCSVRDYKPHKPDCWVTAIDAFLAENP